MDYDQTTMPASYDAGRGYSPAVLQFWLNAISSATAGPRFEDILDLGCGTGRYSAALAKHFRARVIAVDPSEKMLVEARKKAMPAVQFEIGCGEHLPLDDASVDMVFMSMVYHHFTDPRKVTSECHRVLRERGTVCLRAATTDRMEGYPFVPFFPQARPLMAESLSSLASIDATFLDAGFEAKHHEVVQSEVAASWSAYAEKVAYRADSILVRLSDTEFEKGLAKLREHARRTPNTERVIEPVDFLVFRRG